MIEKYDKTKFFFVGNNLSLDFVNTKIIQNGEPLDLLTTFGDLVVWASVAGLISDQESNQFLKTWDEKAESQKAITMVRIFRQNLLETVRLFAESGQAKPLAIKEINGYLREKSGYTELRKKTDGFEKRYHFNLEKPEHLLVPIAESAADLLCYGESSLLKQCESKECVLYFYDTTKNHRRRWCSMATCGNRAKAAAFYQRQKNKFSNL